MYFHDVSEEAKLYYIFMLADGETSEEEQRKFDEICTMLELDKVKRKEVKDFCSLKMKNCSNDFIKVKTVIREVLKINDGEDRFTFYGVTSTGATDKARIIWTMINLGYSDSEFAKIEMSIINYLVDVFEFDQILYKDMLDTAETILSLTDHKEWIGKQRWSHDKTYGEITRIDKKIKQLYKNVQQNIDEILYIQEA